MYLSSLSTKLAAGSVGLGGLGKKFLRVTAGAHTEALANAFSIRDHRQGDDLTAHLGICICTCEGLILRMPHCWTAVQQLVPPCSAASKLGHHANCNNTARHAHACTCLRKHQHGYPWHTMQRLCIGRQLRRHSLNNGCMRCMNVCLTADHHCPMRRQCCAAVRL